MWHCTATATRQLRKMLYVQLTLLLVLIFSRPCSSNGSLFAQSNNNYVNLELNVIRYGKKGQWYQEFIRREDCRTTNALIHTKTVHKVTYT